MLLLDSSQGANYKIHSLHHDVVPLATKGMRAGRQPVETVESRETIELPLTQPTYLELGQTIFFGDGTVNIAKHIH